MVVKGESEMLPSMPFLHTAIVNEIRAIIDRLFPQLVDINAQKFVHQEL